MAIADSVSPKLQSKAFPKLFERLDSNQYLRVLDVGPAVSETVNFFSQYRCKLHFADLFAENDIISQQKGNSEEFMQQQFSDLFDYPEGTQFDICLFWGFLNYLDTPALRGFDAALRPYLHKDTRAHGFGVLNSRTALKNQQYGVLQADTLVVRERQDAPLTCYPHPQSELLRLLGSFDMSKGLLLSDGKLEMLLKASV